MSKDDVQQEGGDGSGWHTAAPGRSRAGGGTAEKEKEKELRRPRVSGVPVRSHSVPSVFVGGLPQGTTEATVRKLFAEFGTIDSVTIKVGMKGGLYCFVDYFSLKSAEKAVSATHGRQFRGERLNVRLQTKENSLQTTHGPGSNGGRLSPAAYPGQQTAPQRPPKAPSAGSGSSSERRQGRQPAALQLAGAARPPPSGLSFAHVLTAGAAASPTVSPARPSCAARPPRQTLRTPGDADAPSPSRSRGGRRERRNSATQTADCSVSPRRGSAAEESGSLTPSNGPPLARRLFQTEPRGPACPAGPTSEGGRSVSTKLCGGSTAGLTAEAHTEPTLPDGCTEETPSELKEKCTGSQAGSASAPEAAARRESQCSASEPDWSSMTVGIMSPTAWADEDDLPDDDLPQSSRSAPMTPSASGGEASLKALQTPSLCSPASRLQQSFSRPTPRFSRPRQSRDSGSSEDKRTPTAAPQHHPHPHHHHHHHHMHTLHHFHHHHHHLTHHHHHHHHHPHHHHLAHLHHMHHDLWQPAPMPHPQWDWGMPPPFCFPHPAVSIYAPGGWDCGVGIGHLWLRAQGQDTLEMCRLQQGTMRRGTALRAQSSSGRPAPASPAGRWLHEHGEFCIEASRGKLFFQEPPPTGLQGECVRSEDAGSVPPPQDFKATWHIRLDVPVPMGMPPVLLPCPAPRESGRRSGKRGAPAAAAQRRAAPPAGPASGEAAKGSGEKPAPREHEDEIASRIMAASRILSEQCSKVAERAPADLQRPSEDTPQAQAQP